MLPAVFKMVSGLALVIASETADATATAPAMDSGCLWVSNDDSTAVLSTCSKLSG